ncbi:MAG: CYTH domain-containing protein [Treponema sp.]|nr:CYTH domain-containing protein [Treponema sp.]
MAVEIELKARLDDPEPVKQRLFSLGTYCRSYEKSDTYWAAGGNIPSSEVRVRREIDTETDGRVREKTLVTYKIKEIRDGIEINDEREFLVAGAGPDGAGGDVFEGLLNRLGLRPFIRKEKKGRSWTVGAPPVLAELSLVKDLGWFLELEILAEEKDERIIAESRKRLLSLLETLDIPPEWVESRPYTEMLKNGKA